MTQESKDIDSCLRRYVVTGMSCAACQARVEKAVSKVPGVDSCAVNLLTNSMGVKGSASDNDVIKAVTDAGYGARIFGAGGESVHHSEIKPVSADDISGSEKYEPSVAQNTSIYAQEEEALRDTTTPRLKKRLITSIVFLLALMYISMGHMMFGFPLPIVFDNMVFSATAEMLLTIMVMIINRDFFTSGFRSLFHGAPNMDTLVAIGSSVSFGYSLVELFIMITAMGNGDSSTVMRYGMNLYFESAAMIPTLITIGKMLEAMSKGRTTDALKGLMKLAPQTAIIVSDKPERDDTQDNTQDNTLASADNTANDEHEVPISDVKTGDIFVVYPGGSIPVDGVILEGMTSVNEAAITGESVPKDKAAGDEVTSGTINQTGYIRCRASRVGEDTTLSKIIRTVSDAASTKAPIARIADKVSGIFVPTVMIIAGITFTGWLIAGGDIGFAIARAITVLVISCPCALGLATPVAIMVGNGVGARNGILYKTSEALENAGRAGTVLLDKTGTITSGQPEVTDVISLGEITDMISLSKVTVSDMTFDTRSDDDHMNITYDCSLSGKDDYFEERIRLLGIAAALESESEHPFARAIIAKAKQQGINADNAAGISRLHADTLKTEAATGSTSFPYMPRICDITILPGNGLTGELDGQIVYGGSLKYISSVMSVPENITKKAMQLSADGKTPLLFAMGNKILGIIAVADAIRDDSLEALREMKSMGLHTVMLTGDNETTANAIGKLAGVDEVIAGVMPDEKADVVKRYSRDGKAAVVKRYSRDGKAAAEHFSGDGGKGGHARTSGVIMIGDGINDAPALVAADTGMAIGAGTDIAIDAADVVLMKSSLMDAVAAIRLSRYTIRNIHENLFWAFIYNIICIPMAAGVFGFAMKPAYGAAAMSLSSFCVCMNALRLNLVKLYHKPETKITANKDETDNTDDNNITADKDEIEKKDKDEIDKTYDSNKKTDKENEIMKKTLKVEGMMCEHCEARVNKALMALDGVESAKADHVTGTVEVEMTSEVSFDKMKEAVESQDYKVIS